MASIVIILLFWTVHTLKKNAKAGVLLPVLGQAQLSLSLSELKPRFVKGLKRLEAHFIKIVKSLSLDLSSITKYWA